jgi:hypothetical protein
MTRRILSIDGGGIKGVFPISFLAAIEQSVGGSIADYFDLIVGTSTGGIIALGLGLGLRAENLLEFYQDFGSHIFQRKWPIGIMGWLVRAKYDGKPLRDALSAVFGSKKLGESVKRLVVPSFNIDTGEVHVWKTAHNPRLERDYLHPVVEVALSTAAAPVYFPIHVLRSGEPLIDGGVWANNPVAIATVEAIGVLDWPASDLRILSLGCTTAPLDFYRTKKHSLGLLGWGWRGKVIDVIMRAQSESAIGMVQHLLPDRHNLVRISPTVHENRFGLDRVGEINSLRGMGNSEARKALPHLRPIFFEKPVLNDFVPFRKINPKSVATDSPSTVDAVASR